MSTVAAAGLGDPVTFNPDTFFSDLSKAEGPFAALVPTTDAKLITGADTIQDHLTAVTESGATSEQKRIAADALSTSTSKLVVEQLVANAGTTLPALATGMIDPNVVTAACNQMKVTFQENQNRKSQTAQLVFVIDGTGSMLQLMNAVKKLIDGLLEDLTDRFSIGFSITFVIYRDKYPNGSTDEVPPTSETIEFKGKEWPDFVNSNSDATSRLKDYMETNFKARSGGDHPEWVNSGLARAITETKWNKSVAIHMIFLFTDAPNHGRQNYIGNISDNYEDGLNSRGEADPEQTEITSLLKTICGHKRMYFTLFKLNPEKVGVPLRETDHLQEMYDNWMTVIDRDPKLIGDKARFARVDVPYGTSKTDFLKPGEILSHVRNSIVASVSSSVSLSKSGYKFDVSTLVLSRIDQLAEAYGAKYQAIAWVLEKLGLSDEIIDTCKEVGIHDRSEFNDAALERMGVNPAKRKAFRELMVNFVTTMDARAKEAAAARPSAAPLAAPGTPRPKSGGMYKRYGINKKSIATKLKKYISKKYRLNKKSIAKKFKKHMSR
jgi:hypothetical protein